MQATSRTAALEIFVGSFFRSFRLINATESGISSRHRDPPIKVAVIPLLFVFFTSFRVKQVMGAGRIIFFQKIRRTVIFHYYYRRLSDKIILSFLFTKGSSSYSSEYIYTFSYSKFDYGITSLG